MEPIGLLVGYLMRPLMRPLIRLDHALQDLVAGIGKNRWPVAQGIIIGSEVATSVPLWSAAVTYAYAADGKRWSGQLIRQLVYERIARNYIASHAIGTPVVVRYDADNPARSVVLRRDQQAFSAEDAI